jgi:Mrp family chromosome partitioning ATPase
MITVPVMSTKGGVGKSTTAANLGAFCADAGIISYSKSGSSISVSSNRSFVKVSPRHCRGLENQCVTILENSS